MDDKHDVEDLAPEALAQMTRDCEAFQASQAEFLAQAGNEEQNGCDYWLTRNRHGAGFWDRGYDQKVGEGLTAAAHADGECYLYVGDDGKIYLG
jgi:hypothetical protein